MFKNRPKPNTYHACIFNHDYREKIFCLEHLIKMILLQTCTECDVEPAHQTNVAINGEGSLHSFSIGMHDMKNLQNKFEWIAST